MPKWIQIWYSWGDQESPVEVPEDKDPWEYMMELAFEEVYCAKEMCDPYMEIGLKIAANESGIRLYYPYDGEYCYYLITDEENYNPWEDKEDA